MEPHPIYRYEKYYFRMFTPLMILITVIFLIYADYLGASITLELGGLLDFSYQGKLIDALKQKYMKYDRFMCWKVVRWESLSTPSYVTIVRINLSSRRAAPSPIVLPQDKKGAWAFKVYLVVEGDERFVSICRVSLELMTEEALRLGRYLGIRVLDYTTNEKKWIL